MHPARRSGLGVASLESVARAVRSRHRRWRRAAAAAAVAAAAAAAVAVSQGCRRTPSSGCVRSARQCAEKMRAAGLVRLELAARLLKEDCTRIGASAPHRTKLLASASRLAERLKERGRGLSKQGGAGGEVYAAAALHYDAETGTFWDEGGGQEPVEDDLAGGSAGPVPASARRGESSARAQQGKGGGPPPNAARQRARNETNKARVGNHSRKQGAARKQARGAFRR